MNPRYSEVKVGIFTFVAFLAMLSLFMWLNGARVFERGYDLETVFDKVDGVRPGAPVKLVGVDVGRVTRVYFEKQHVVVTMNIRKGVTIPPAVKTVISSAGVVGDKFIEIVPLAQGEHMAEGKRIIGQTPVTMDQFYATTYQVLVSLKEIADTVNHFTSDPLVTNSLKNSLARVDQITAEIEKATSQLGNMDLSDTTTRIKNISVIAERLLEQNEPQVKAMVGNITATSLQLAQASMTANRFIAEIENNGQTVAQTRQIMDNIQHVSADLEKFSSVLVSQDKGIDLLINDAHQTMQSINQAAIDIDKAVNKLANGEGNVSQIKTTIEQTSQAVAKVNKVVNVFEKIVLKNNLGVSYDPNGLGVDYNIDLAWDKINSIKVGLDDIGQRNNAMFQWSGNYDKYAVRAGLYKSQFGLGMDVPVTTHSSISADLWDTHSPNLGLASHWQLAKDWRLSLSASTNFQNNDVNWGLKLGYKW